MNQLLSSLLQLALAWSLYDEPVALPAVEIIPSGQMPCHCKGLFLYAQPYSGYEGLGTRQARLLLREDVDLSTAYGQSILLHELVHALQAQQGAVASGTRQWHIREREAYRLQYRFMRATGLTYLDESFAPFVDLQEPWSPHPKGAKADGSGGNPEYNGLISDARPRRFE